MTNKTVRQLFVEKLAKVGVKLVNMLPDDMGDPMEALTEDQFTALDAAIDDIVAAGDQDGYSRGFRAGVADACSTIDKRELPAPTVVDSLDAVEWANAFGRDRMAIQPQHMAGWFALAIEAGRQANRVRGLNSDDDAVAFDVPEVNAVEFVMADGGKVWVNVDGRSHHHRDRGKRGQPRSSAECRQRRLTEVRQAAYHRLAHQQGVIRCVFGFGGWP